MQCSLGDKCVLLETIFLNCVLICNVFTGAQYDLLTVNVKDTSGIQAFCNRWPLKDLVYRESFKIL